MCASTSSISFKWLAKSPIILIGIVQKEFKIKRDCSTNPNEGISPFEDTFNPKKPKPQ